LFAPYFIRLTGSVTQKDIVTFFTLLYHNK